jgi:hypothetical protein
MTTTGSDTMTDEPERRLVESESEPLNHDSAALAAGGKQLTLTNGMYYGIVCLLDLPLVY